MVNSSGVGLFIFYFPPVPQAPLGVSDKSECTIFKGYTYGVIYHLISDCNCEYRPNLQII